MTTTRNRVEVMHGANLDMLASRDPEHYGDFSLTELEGRIEGWAKERASTRGSSRRTTRASSSSTSTGCPRPPTRSS